MYKHEYLERLRKALKGVDKEETDRLVDYYREIIEDGLESGGGEEFIMSLEPPELVAQNYKREAGLSHEPANEQSYKSNDNENKQKTHNGGGKNNVPTVIRVLMMIVCVFFAFVGAIVLFSIGVAAFSIIASGIFTFIASFALIGRHVGAGFAQMGYAIMIIAIGSALWYVIPFLGRLYIYVIRYLSLTQPEPPKFYGKRKVYISYGGAFATGLLLFLIAFASLGFSYNRLACLDDLVLKEKSFEVTESFTLISGNLGLDVEYYDGSEIKLEYYDFDNEPKKISENNGVVTLDLSDGITLGTWGLIWKHGVFFSNFSGKYYEATLYLPRDFDSSLSIELKNGAIGIDGMHFDDLTLETHNGAVAANDIVAANVKMTSHNGAILIKNCTASDLSLETHNGATIIQKVEADNVTAITKNGYIKIENVDAASIEGESNNGKVKLDKCAAQKIYCKTDNGTVAISRIKGDDIELQSGNGAITGTILGKKTDYKIDARTGSGSNNLENRHEGTKILKARTGNGAIKITFVE